MTTYEYLNLFASYGGLGLIYYGIRIMDKNAVMRAVDSERKHNETMAKHDEAMAESRRREEDGLRRHEESMAESRRREEESKRRHEEAMEDIRRREEDSKRRHEESMASLRELIDGQTESRMALRELIERTR